MTVQDDADKLIEKNRLLRLKEAEIMALMKMRDDVYNVMTKKIDEEIQNLKNIG